MLVMVEDGLRGDRSSVADRVAATAVRARRDAKFMCEFGGALMVMPATTGSVVKSRTCRGG